MFVRIGLRPLALVPSLKSLLHTATNYLLASRRYEMD